MAKGRSGRVRQTHGERLSEVGRMIPTTDSPNAERNILNMNEGRNNPMGDGHPLIPCRAATLLRMSRTTEGHDGHELGPAGRRRTIKLFARVYVWRSDLEYLLKCLGI